MYKLRLKEIRIAAGYKTQQEIADRLGMKVRKYASWEREEVALTFEDACMLTDFLGCTLNDLCGWYDTHPRKPSDIQLDSDEIEIIKNYRQSTPQWRQNIAMTARAAAGESKEAAEPAVPVTEKRLAV